MSNPFDAVPALFLLLVTFPLFAMAIMRVVGMLIEGSLEVLPGVIVIGIILAMLGTMAITKDPVLPWVILLVVATAFAFYPFAARQMLELDHRRINKDSIENAYEAWAMRPDNTSAGLSLARGLYEHGYRAAGIRLAESLLAPLSSEFDIQTMRSQREIFKQEDHLLKKWQREFDPNTAPSILCKHCKTLNDPSQLECANCGKPHVLEAMRRGDKVSHLAGKLMLGWTLIAGLIVALVAVMSNVRSPFPFVALVIGLSLIGFVFSWLFRQPKFDSTMYRPIVED